MTVASMSVDSSCFSLSLSLPAPLCEQKHCPHRDVYVDVAVRVDVRLYLCFSVKMLKTSKNQLSYTYT